MNAVSKPSLTVACPAHGEGATESKMSRDNWNAQHLTNTVSSVKRVVCEDYVGRRAVSAIPALDGLSQIKSVHGSYLILDVAQRCH